MYYKLYFLTKCERRDIMKKKFLSAFLALCLVLSLLPGTAFAAEETSGSCGNNLTWTLDNGVLTISGSGAMRNYSYNSWYEDGSSVPTYVIDAPWYNLRENIREVIINSGVTSIGSYAFGFCEMLNKVTIPSTVKTIQIGAFFVCSSLTRIEIPDGITIINANTFCNCSSLTHIDIPDSVTRISGQAFAGCKSLTNVDLPKNLNYIGKSAFVLAGLTSIELPQSLTAVSEYAFDRCRNLKDISIPDSITTIEGGAFSYCTSLTSVIIPDSVRTIGSGAFASCTSLMAVTISDGVENIGSAAFGNCDNLTEIFVPSSVTSIGELAFAGSQMQAILVDENNPRYRSIDGVLYTRDLSTLVMCPEGKTGRLVIPDGVTTFEVSGYHGPLSGCKKLTGLTIPGSVTMTSYVNIIHFPGESSTSREVYADLAGCPNLTSAGPIGSGCDIEFGWTDTIPDGTFEYDEHLKTVILPEGLTSLEYTFSGCTGLTSLTIPRSVTSIKSAVSKYDSPNLIIYCYKDSYAHQFAQDEEITFVLLDKEPDPDPEAPSITLSPKTLSFSLGETGEITVTTTPAGMAYILSSSNEEVVSVSDTTLTANKLGWAEITATLVDHPDVTAVCSVTVTEPDLEKSEITLTLWTDANCTKPITAMTSTYGSFSWEQTGGNYDTVYLKAEWVGVENDGVVLTAPEGFSFAPYEMVTTRNLSVLAGGSGVEVVPVYPIYAESPGTELTFAVEGTDTKLTIPVTENSEAGNVYYRDSFTEQPTGSMRMSDFNLSWFDTVSTQYNHSLALLSAALSAAAYNKEGIEKTLANIGFANVKPRNYHNNDQISMNQNQVACAFATKKYLADDGKVETIVAAVIRGTVEKEWYSNFDVGDGYTHQGFENGEKYVLSEFQDYMAKLQSDGLLVGRTKILITGHSRAAAVADLLALDLNTQYRNFYAEHDNLYTYTFATPNSVSNSEFHSLNVQNNIFNINNYQDFVTHVPGKFYSLGKNFHINFPGDDDYSAKFSRFMYYYDRLVTNQSPTHPEYLTWPALQLELIVGLENKDATYLANQYGDKLAELALSGKPSDVNEQNFANRVRCNHAMETYICWLNVISDGYKFSEPANATYIKLMCPVDVTVYNEQGTVVSRIVDNEVVQCDGPYCGVSGDEKVFYLANSSYTFEITGYDSGSMDIEITEYDEDNQQSKFVSYLDIPVETGETVTLDAENCGLANSRYSLVMDGEQRDADYTATGSELNKFTVTADAEGSGYALGSGSYSEGQRVTLYALTDNGLFSGWYADGTLVSSDSTYSFTAMEDVSITAKFTSTTPIPPTPGHIHSWSAAWSRDESHHWHECLAGGCTVTSNGKKAGYGAHVYDDDTDTTCNTCGYIRTVTPPAPEHIHNWSAVWSHDKNCHWCECLVDGCTVTANSEKAGYGAHSYDDDADTTCNTCGYVREITPPAPEHTHDWSAAWSGDENHHWHNCTAVDCPITTDSQKDGYAAHTSDGSKVTTPATPYQNGVRTYSCTVCGYVIRTESIPATGGGSSSGGGSGGGTSNGYTVSVPSHMTGGTVRVSPNRADKGATVIITTTPNSGYELDRLTVTDANGNELELKDIGNGRFTFTMPSSRVTADPAFTAVTNPPTEPENPETPVRVSFTDVPSGAYYYDAVTWAVEQGITSGTSTTTFSPSASCTRAQMVTFLWRAAGSPAPRGGVNPFADVQSGSYYYDAVLWAVEQGITSGTSATTFSPDAAVTRGQTVTFLYRAAGSPAAGGSNSFGDVASNTYYASAVQWAVGKGVISGTSATTFSPNDDCTRAQIVTFLYLDRAN